MGTRNKRAKDWAIIAYPESLPEGWQEELKKIPCAISPLHDRDTWSKRDELKNPEHKAGELKKPHYHILLKFDGLKCKEQVQEIADLINATSPEIIHSPYGYYRYLTHTDDPDKAQYLEEDIQLLGGYTEPELKESKLTRRQEKRMLMDMTDICRLEMITSLDILQDYICNLNRENPSEEYESMAYLVVKYNGYFAKYTAGISRRIQRNPQKLGVIYADRIYRENLDYAACKQAVRDRAEYMDVPPGYVAKDFGKAALKRLEDLFQRKGNN